MLMRCWSFPHSFSFSHYKIAWHALNGEWWMVTVVLTQWAVRHTFKHLDEDLSAISFRTFWSWKHCSVILGCCCWAAALCVLESQWQAYAYNERNAPSWVSRNWSSLHQVSLVKYKLNHYTYVLYCPPHLPEFHWTRTEDFIRGICHLNAPESKSPNLRLFWWQLLSLTVAVMQDTRDCASKV